MVETLSASLILHHFKLSSYGIVCRTTYHVTISKEKDKASIRIPIQNSSMWRKISRSSQNNWKVRSASEKNNNNNNNTKKQRKN